MQVGALPHVPSCSVDAVQSGRFLPTFGGTYYSIFQVEIFTVQKKAIGSYEMLITTCQTIRGHIPE
jgi:hypothetical protein